MAKILVASGHRRDTKRSGGRWEPGLFACLPVRLSNGIANQQSNGFSLRPEDTVRGSGGLSVQPEDHVVQSSGPSVLLEDHVRESYWKILYSSLVEYLSIN